MPVYRLVAALVVASCAEALPEDPGAADPGLADCGPWCVDLGCPAEVARCEMGTCACFGCEAFDAYIADEGVLGVECQ
jgi:hypothetical protein